MGTAHLLEPLLGESFAERRAEAKSIPYLLPPSEKQAGVLKIRTLVQSFSSVPRSFLLPGPSVLHPRLVHPLGDSVSPMTPRRVTPVPSSEDLKLQGLTQRLETISI